MKTIDNLSDYYESYEISLDPKNEEIYLFNSLEFSFKPRCEGVPGSAK
ncbi:hypothetical protein [Vagococcus fluvialis]